LVKEGLSTTQGGRPGKLEGVSLTIKNGERIGKATLPPSL